MKEDDVEKRSISRRNFLKTAGGAAAIAGLAASGIPMTAGNAQAADALPKKWDETYDVVVIGSGFAGLAAAIEAKNNGAKDVVVLEKCRPTAETLSSTAAISALRTRSCRRKTGFRIPPN